MARPIISVIDTSALKNNLKIIRNIVPKSHIWSVIKANAYGHGIHKIWKSLSQTDGFALLEISDAIFLRKKNFKKPILLLEGFFHSDELKIIDKYRLTIVVHSEWQIETIAKTNFSSPLNIYLKINNGMNRLGFNIKHIYKIFERLRQIKNIGMITLMSHFYFAKNKKKFALYSKNIFRIKKKIGCQCSLSSSGSILWNPNIKCDWVRPGIILYGVSPTGQWKDIAYTNLLPVMTLKSKIISIQNIESGDSIGYGAKYISKIKKRIGIVACGYADGYPRHAPNGTPVIVDDVYTNTLGAISMDMMMVDLTFCPKAKIGSNVELWGKNIKIDDIANISGTIGYELLSKIMPRVQIRIK